jgi:hypothetical protein
LYTPGAVGGIDNNIRIGENNDGRYDYRGSLDELRFYNKTLDSNDIKAIYDSESGNVIFIPGPPAPEFPSIAFAFACLSVTVVITSMLARKK